MSKIDYQALREAAEKATWGDWDSYKPHRGARGYEVRLSSQAIAQHVLKNNAEFIAAFNPKIALALLDERERNQQYIKSRDQENEDIALTVGKLRVELEAAEKRIAELEAEPVSNSDELPLDYLQGHKDGLEWAAQLAEANHPQTGDWLYDDQIDLARAIRKGPDMPTVQGGSSPVTPDGWISCSERMPEKNQNVLISVNFDSSLVEPLICSARYTGSTFRRGDATIKPGNGIEQATHWMPLPEPPQEVNRG
ncbi:TPA: ead/Ea22-like family protein [Escherichia coli]